jgi:hypothetical protein
MLGELSPLAFDNVAPRSRGHSCAEGSIVRELVDVVYDIKGSYYSQA